MIMLKDGTSIEKMLWYMLELWQAIYTEQN